MKIKTLILHAKWPQTSENMRFSFRVDSSTSEPTSLVQNQIHEKIHKKKKLRYNIYNSIHYLPLQMADQQQQSAKRTCSSPSGILKREFAQLDRQYSYENTLVSTLKQDLFRESNAIQKKLTRWVYHSFFNVYR